MLTHGGFLLIPAAASIYFFKPPYAIDWVIAEFIGLRNRVYQWRSLPRVRRHRASSSLPGISVTGGAILQVTMDQLMRASLFPHPL